MKLRRTLLGSTIAHLAMVLLLVIVPAILHLVSRPKPREIATFVDFQVEAPRVVSEAPALPKLPEPESPKDIPEPPKEKKKPEIKKSETRIKKPAPPRPQPPRLSPEEIRKMIQSSVPSSPGATAMDPSALSLYYALVRERMYQAWNQPGELSGNAGLRAEVVIRVQRDGSITRREMTRSSGHPTMDDSVMRAVNSVTRLKPLPAEIYGSSKDISIEFDLTSATF